MKWPQVFRVVWLSGGVVAVNEAGPDVVVSAGVNGRLICKLQTPTFEELFATLRTHRLSTLGTTFVVHQEEVMGLRPPEFRAMGPTGWLVWDTKHKWRQVAFAAAKADQMPLLDVASRIASGLTYSQIRLYDIASAYSTQLRCCLHKSEPEPYRAFKDMNSFAVYKSIHALFWEMAVLRDTLAEFAAAYCFSIPSVPTSRGLRAFLVKNKIADPLATQLLQATDQVSRGWIATFTDYRNLFTHAAPMEQVANVASAVQDLRHIPNGVAVPQIYYALPSNVEELTQRRSVGAHFKTMKELAAASSRKHDRTVEPDALDYLHFAINQFGALALNLVDRSPIAPKPIMIGPEDMIGGVPRVE